MIRPSPAPSERAASTYSFSRSDSTCPRTMRATDAQLKNAITSDRHRQARPGDRHQRDRDEQERERQHDVDQPGEHRVDDAAEVAGREPDDDADRPRSMAVATTPTSSEIRAPYAIRTRMSRPRSSVPSQKVPFGPTGRPSGVRPVSRYCSFGAMPGDRARPAARRSRSGRSAR